MIINVYLQTTKERSNYIKMLNDNKIEKNRIAILINSKPK